MSAKRALAAVIVLAVTAAGPATAAHAKKPVKRTYSGTLGEFGTIDVRVAANRISLDYSSTATCDDGTTHGVGDEWIRGRIGSRGNFKLESYRSDYGDDETQGGLSESATIVGHWTKRRITGTFQYGESWSDLFSTGPNGEQGFHSCDAGPLEFTAARSRR